MPGFVPALQRSSKHRFGSRSYDCWQCHQAVPVQYRPGWRRPTRLLPQRINQLPNNRDAASSAHCAMRSCQSRRQRSGSNAQNAKRLVPHRTGHKFDPPPREWVAGRVVGQTRVSADRFRAIPSAIAIQQDSPRLDTIQGRRLDGQAARALPACYLAPARPDLLISAIAVPAVVIGGRATHDRLRRRNRPARPRSDDGTSHARTEVDRLQRHAPR